MVSPSARHIESSFSNVMPVAPEQILDGMLASQPVSSSSFWRWAWLAIAKRKAVSMMGGPVIPAGSMGIMAAQKERNALE
ncbi:hypothetical protein G6F31_018090 [Rhizopus arrhizus]|nr:hypothetical protein G6F31_018090 [Rhizopus arrhizus]